MLIHQLQRQRVGHFLHDQKRLLEGIRTGKHLSGAEAAAFRLVGLNVGDGAGLPAPRVVDEQLGVHAEQVVEHVLVQKRLARDVAHRIKAAGFQAAGVAGAHAPEIRQRTVLPQEPSVAHFVQLGNAHAVFIRRNVLRADVQRDFAEVQVRADARRGRDAGCAQHVQNELHGEIARGQAGGGEVFGGVDEHLVDGIHVNVLRVYIFDIDAVDARAVFHIARHLRRRDQIGELPRGIGLYLGGQAGFSGEGMAGRGGQANGVDGVHTLNHLEQPRTTRHAPRLQRRGDGQTDGLLGAAFVRDDQMDVHGIQPAQHAFHRREKGLEINGHIGAFAHASSSPLFVLLLYPKTARFESAVFRPSETIKKA